MIKNRKISVIPTMITPYTLDNQVDYDGIKALVRWYWKNNCDGIFAVCQSSEIFYLSLDERVKIGQTVVNESRYLAAQDKTREPMQIFVSGHISDDFNSQVEELTAMSGIGADALILITNRLDVENSSDKNWIKDLNKLIDKIPQDVLLGLYECPKPYKRLLTDSMLNECKKNSRFRFIKDTCCDADIIKNRIKILTDSDVLLYNANAQTLLETVKAGANGYCGVMANFHPKLYKLLFDNLESENVQIIQSYLCLAAFTESLAYPATAKYYLRTFENINIESFSRAVDCNLITDYQKSCLSQMKKLGDYINETLC